MLKRQKFSYITNTLNSENSNISESYSTVIQNDFIYDTKFFTQNLETFFCFVFFCQMVKNFYSSKK